VAFPIKTLDHAILRDILAGGIAKIAEAGAVLAGGHSIDDPEVKYGLSVTGLVHPEHIWTNTGARDQDVLLLTKALGSGVLATALKAGFCSEEEISAALELMSRLNKLPGESSAPAWRGYVHACTDVTGFGLLGHLSEMVADEMVGAVIELSGIPFMSGAEKYCSMGLFPEGGARNRDFFSCRLSRQGICSDILYDLLFDPQTSGGLLLAVDPQGVSAVCQAFLAAGQDCWEIGRFTADFPGRIVVA
jgi:selenide,water dikinase